MPLVVVVDCDDFEPDSIKHESYVIVDDDGCLSALFYLYSERNKKKTKENQYESVKQQNDNNRVKKNEITNK